MTGILTTNYNLSWSLEAEGKITDSKIHI